MPDDIYQVYALSDPRNKAIRYVGMSKDAQIRLREHLKGKEDAYLTPWIKELATLNLRPLVTILETVTGRKATLAAEARWIKELGKTHNLENRSHNIDTLTERAHRDDDYHHISRQFASYPVNEGKELTRLHWKGYQRYQAVWDYTLTEVTATVAELETLGLLRHFTEIDIAKLTHRVFGDKSEEL